MKQYKPVPPLLSEVQALANIGFFPLLLQALLTGSFAALVIGAFRFAYTKVGLFLTACVHQNDLLEPFSLIALFCLLLLASCLSAALLRYEPLISGSGIPQVELMLAGRLPLMNWARVLFAKFTGTLISLSSGLSLGREGPCIQMGACAGLAVQRLLRQASGHSSGRFLIGGGVAGMTAAFGAPLAGLFFAFEEMRVVLTLPLLLFCALAAASAYIVIHWLLGFDLVFPFLAKNALRFSQYWIVVPLGVSLGLLGTIYNALLIRLTLLADGLKFSPWLRLLPVFLLSGLLLLFFPLVLTNFGLAAIDLSRLSLPLSLLLLVLCAKILFSAVSFASGASGGLLMPMLMAGALFGCVSSQLLLAAGMLSPEQADIPIILSMAGLFAATVRAPLTGSALLMEMSGCPELLFALLGTAFLAVFVANVLGSEPVYESLKQRIVRIREASACQACSGKNQ
ncbi:MAG: chloride channel protein [Desulfovibrio sp.]|nr:chloride channel protein [Desulfovibrio sp.]